MDDARTEASRSARNPFAMAATDRARPFPPPQALHAVNPQLGCAALDVLAATARAWGLQGRVPEGRQAS